MVTALCLGAKFVFLGRPTLYGVVAGAEAGATKALAILRDETDLVMCQIGAATIGDLGRDFVEWEPDAVKRNTVRWRSRSLRGRARSTVCSYQGSYWYESAPR